MFRSCLESISYQLVHWHAIDNMTSILHLSYLLPYHNYVYVKNAKGNIIKVSFGDTTGLSIKRDNPARRKSFRARHNCDTAKDKTSARYWSCYQWRANAPVDN